eukprot:TRINITY_DN2109_c0_g1_i1.p1 TRINITY_DN2109_c0_g1~~TRINITY_DN2109_c0_g1_i1.p1  ORF type:complete len:432 (-),score=73.87 TRINITY_DN2109_c0_g1_i1:428-1576(-)
MSAVKIKLRGSGRVHFTSTRQVSRTGADGKTKHETETVHHRSSEEYLDQEAVLFHGPGLGVGRHVFPFTLFLGPNLPSSFEGKYGSVRYYLEGVIVREWLWNHRTKEHITVNSILDLNEYPACVHPGQDRNHKTFCCWCCKSGPLSVVIATDKQGYVPGEYLVFNAEVDNKSDKEMSDSQVELIETIAFKAGREKKVLTRTVAKMERGKVEPGDSDIWDRVPMLIPPLPPSFLGHGRPCGIIDLSYTLHFKVNPAGIGFSLKSQIPITIGSIPLRTMFNQIQPYGAFAPPGGIKNPGGAYPPSYDVADKFPGGEGGGYSSAPPLPDNFINYHDLPPPTYAESVWGQVNVRGEDDDENTHGDFQFVPRYPTYNFTQPSAPPKY